MKKMLLYPVVVQIVTVIFLVYGLFATDSKYKLRIILFSAILVAIWSICIRKCGSPDEVIIKDRKHVLKSIGFITIAFAIALFFSCAMWNKGALSLAPIARINLGISHQDELFHSAIVESFNRSLLPSSLVNDEATLRYHTFSHLLMYLISRITSVPAFAAYNYLYPVVFLPLYSFAQLYAVISAKEFFSGSKELSIMDYSIVALFNCGIFGNTFLSGCGIWKASSFSSESYLVGSILVFFFYAIFLKAIRKKEKSNIVYKRIFLFAVIPLGIFLISWSKISLGCLFTISILYYFFRTRLKQKRYWVLNLFYLFVFYICIKLFRSGGDGIIAGNSGQMIQWLAFGKYYCKGHAGILGHYLFLSLMGIIFVLLEIKNNRYTLSDIFQGKTLWIEEVALLSIAAFTPGLILNIGGGSAAYFSYFAEIPAMLLLCGKGYVRKLSDDQKSLKDNLEQVYKRKQVFLAGLFIWCICIGFINSADILRSEELIPDDNGIGFYEELMQIREMVGDSPEKYTIYLEPDAKVTKILEHPLSQIYVYPALTCVGVINASYVQDGLYFNFQDAPVKGYGLTSVQHEKLSWNMALKRARDLGKEKVIHMMKDDYEVVNCR